MIGLIRRPHYEVDHLLSAVMIEVTSLDVYVYEDFLRISIGILNLLYS